MKPRKSIALTLTAILAASFVTGCQNKTNTTASLSVKSAVNNSSKVVSSEEKSNASSTLSSSLEIMSDEEENNYSYTTSDSSETISSEEKNNSSSYVNEPSINPKNITSSGECGKNGDNVKWILDRLGTLTIYGSGEMQDYTADNRPWDYCKDEIQKVMIEYGVTSIGIYAFYSCDNLSVVAIPRSVTKVGDASFRNCKNLKSISFPDSVRGITNSIF